MSSGHGNSRRQAYGRRMKELRTRRSSDLEVDLEGPNGWSRVMPGMLISPWTVPR